MLRAINETLSNIKEDLVRFAETPSDWRVVCVDPEESDPTIAPYQWEANIPIWDVVPGGTLSKVPDHLMIKHVDTCNGTAHRIMLVRTYPDIEVGAK